MKINLFISNIYFEIEFFIPVLVEQLIFIPFSSAKAVKNSGASGFSIVGSSERSLSKIKLPVGLGADHSPAFISLAVLLLTHFD